MQCGMRTVALLTKMIVSENHLKIHNNQRTFYLEEKLPPDYNSKIDKQLLVLDENHIGHNLA